MSFPILTEPIIFIKKSILADDYIANLLIEYPADLQEEYETMVERVSETFQIP